MGNQHTLKVSGFQAQAFKTTLCFTQRESAVQQDTGLSCLDQGSVAFTTTAQ